MTVANPTALAAAVEEGLAHHRAGRLSDAEAAYRRVITVQPDHPDRKVDLDSLLEYAVENKYDDLFTVDNKGTRNGSVRIMKKEFVESGEISRRVGSYVDNCTNVHSEQDLIDAEANIKIKERLYELGNEGE